MENVKEMKREVTSIVDLREYAKGSLVELPSFGEGQPFYARLRRPSLLGLVKKGKIPNSLLSSANALFESGVQGAMMVADENTMENIFGVMDAICEASFVEPTYKEIIESGITLTDEQMMFIFAYSQNGVRQLDSFRTE